MSDNPVQDLQDDDVLVYTRRIRREFIDGATSGGMPVDPKDRAAVLQAMADMDRAALANKRITKDEQIANTQANAANLLAQMFGQSGNRDPFAAGETIEGTAEEVLPEVPDRLIEDAEFVEGESEIGISRENYEEFTRKNEL